MQCWVEIALIKGGILQLLWEGFFLVVLELLV